MSRANEYRITLKDYPAHERPRERLFSLGASSLSDAELLAILIGTGSTAQTAVELSRQLLRLGEANAAPGDQGVGLRYLVAAAVEELSQLPGIGPAKAARIKAAVELGRRLATCTANRPAVNSPADAAALLMESMRHLDREHFNTLILNTKNQVLAIEPVSVGSLNSSLVHPREIFKAPLRRSAAAVVLTHNHPSGDPTPSPEDVEVTRRLVEAGRILGIEVLDHVIIGDNRYCSLRERGLM